MGLRYILFGTIVRVHGLDGAVKLIPYLPPPHHIGRIRIVFKGGETCISQMRVLGKGENFLIVRIKGYNSREKAYELKGCKVEVPRFKLPPDHFYINDIIGIDVFEENGRYIGKLQEVLHTGGNDVFRILNGRRDLLFPALKRLVRTIDLKKKKMIVIMPEGLEETVIKSSDSSFPRKARIL